MADNNNKPVYLLGWGADFRIGFTEATNHKFMVRSDGNVGIGTMSPSERLTVNGNADVSGVVKVGDTTSAQLVLNANWPAGLYMENGDANMRFYNSHAESANYGHFIWQGLGGVKSRAPKDSSNTEYMRLTSQGSLGISTAAPSEKLHINQGKLRIDDGNNWLLLGDHASSTAGIAMADGNSPVYLHAWGANFKMAFGSPTNHKVDITPSGSATFSGSVRATSFPTTSDARLKDVLADYDAGVARLSKVHPKVYRYREGNARNHSSAETHVGFLAQELLAAGLTHAVHQSEPDGYYSVDSLPLLATAINAINEQQAMIDAQSTTIAEQQAELKEQRATIALQDERLAKLERMVMALTGTGSER